MSTPTMSTPLKPKAIIFDLLTALLDSWTLWDASTPTGTPHQGRPWRTHYLATTYSSTVYGPGSTYEELVTRSAHASNIPASSAQALLQNWAHLQPWPEVGHVLRKLRAKGYLLGVVTNCSKELGRVGVRNVERAASSAASSSSSSSEGQGEEEGEEAFKFDAAVTAEEAGFYKPALQAYHAVLPLLGDGDVKPEEGLFVAGRAGFRVVWHNRVGLVRGDGEGGVVPEREARGLEEVLEGLL